ncbi:FMN-dependent NADH-azoreductase [Paenibacillus sp. N1-5-1-14]|uniref:FMN-dependent NADH-azoreductase n=1 Tax=Paenibacillus radicibacter TaxID=2972488 RepID=UPI002158F717|nr:FMN-dependent NADH-azoreductase [Paenibacillus radicibacter]MCR8643550.1 FMN-dependent NADH-azoreductase [Paenibacillus radicibacter]
MSNVLFIKANPRPADQAVSVKMYDAFVASYRETHPNDNITELDLFAENLPYYGLDMINGKFKARSGYELTEGEKQAVEVVDKYLNQFLGADKVMIAFPLWNATVPAPLHTYFDYLNQAGTTFGYTAEGPVGLVKGKKLALLNARGGDYSNYPYEMCLNFASNTFSFFGIEDIEKLVIEGHNQYPDRSEAIVQDGLEKVRSAAIVF